MLAVRGRGEGDTGSGVVVSAGVAAQFGVQHLPRNGVGVRCAQLVWRTTGSDRAELPAATKTVVRQSQMCRATYSYMRSEQEQCLKSVDRLGKGRTFPGDR